MTPNLAKIHFIVFVVVLDKFLENWHVLFNVHLFVDRQTAFEKDWFADSFLADGQPH